MCYSKNEETAERLSMLEREEVRTKTYVVLSGDRIHKPWTHHGIRHAATHGEPHVGTMVHSTEKSRHFWCVARDSCVPRAHPEQ